MRICKSRLLLEASESGGDKNDWIFFLYINLFVGN